jgi:hypothetical protein
MEDARQHFTHIRAYVTGEIEQGREEMMVTQATNEKQNSERKYL